MAQPRNLITIGKNSEATVVQTSHNLGSHSGFLNQVTEIHLDQDARMNLYLVQDDAGQSSQITSTDVFQEKKLPEAAWEILKRERFFGMIIPKKYGGLEFSPG